MEPVLKSAQVLKQEAEEIGFEGKDILEYVKEQQKLDREERAVWREAQKMQAQADVELAKMRAEAEAEERKRADQAEEKKRADEIRFAQIEIEKELKIKEMELQAQQAQAQATISSATTPPPRNKDAKSPSYLLLLMRRTNLTATCYTLNATLKMLVGRRTHGLLS